MKSRLAMVVVSLSVPAAMILSLPTPALAAGPYDATWQVDADPAGTRGTNTTGNAQCEAQRLRF